MGCCIPQGRILGIMAEETMEIIEMRKEKLEKSTCFWPNRMKCAILILSFSEEKSVFTEQYIEGDSQ